MNCHECRFSGPVPGSCHLSCNHPLLEGGGHGGQSLRVLCLIAAAITGGCEPFGITIHNHGLKNGWACWPMDFDPVWIDGCNKFEPREQPKEALLQ